MKPLLSLLLLLSACGSDHSPEAEKKVVSLDLLGIMSPNFPCEKYLKELEEADEINLGYLAGGTFGDQRGCIDRLVKDHRTRAMRVHLCSGPCVTHSRCHPQECLDGVKWSDTTAVLDRLRSSAGVEFHALQDEGFRGSAYVSPVLEHQLDTAAFDRAADMLRRLAEEYGIDIEIVDNPLYPRPSKYLLEVHEKFEAVQQPYIYSADGALFDNGFLPMMHDDALVAYEWRPEFNGICIGEEWVSPLERRCF